MSVLWEVTGVESLGWKRSFYPTNNGGDWSRFCPTWRAVGGIRSYRGASRALGVQVIMHVRLKLCPTGAGSRQFSHKPPIDQTFLNALSMMDLASLFILGWKTSAGQTLT
jgi:hypothetical protein